MDPKIERLLALMEENPGERLSLADMAEVVGLSPSRLRHKFKSEIGITPTLYLQRLRLQRARELLRREGLSVKEIRAAVGIGSASYFSRRYKRVYGIPPSQSRSEQSSAGMTETPPDGIAT